MARRGTDRIDQHRSAGVQGCGLDQRLEDAALINSPVPAAAIRLTKRHHAPQPHSCEDWLRYICVGHALGGAMEQLLAYLRLILPFDGKYDNPRRTKLKISRRAGFCWIGSINHVAGIFSCLLACMGTFRTDWLAGVPGLGHRAFPQLRLCCTGSW